MGRPGENSGTISAHMRYGLCEYLIMKAHTQQRESSLAHTLTRTEPTLAEFKLDAEMTRDHNRAARAPHPRRGSTPWGYQEATPQQSGGRHGMRSRRPFGVCLRWSHQSTLRSGEAARPRACTASARRPLTGRNAPAAAFAAAPALAPGRLRTRVRECGRRARRRLTRVGESRGRR